MRILHVLDASANWQHRVALTQLITKPPQGDWSQHVAVIDPAGRSAVNHLTDINIEAAYRRAGLAVWSGPALRAICERLRIDLIHAWGVDSAAAAKAARPDHPMALTVFDPGLSGRDIRVIRTVAASTKMGVTCAADRVRRRLVERGVPFESCALIRPAVDFAVVSAARSLPIRKSLGIAQEAMVVLTPPPDRDAYGHLPALWSVLVRSHLPGAVRLIIPETSPTQRRIERLVKTCEHPRSIVFSRERFCFEDLLSIADFFVIPATGDMAVTSLGWAMASSVPIIAAADYSVAEILSNDLNSVLFKIPNHWTRTGFHLCKLYQKQRDWRRLTEVARGQAYEVFGLRRCVRQTAQLWENLIAGKSVADGITDPAIHAA